MEIKLARITLFFFFTLFTFVPMKAKACWLPSSGTFRDACLAQGGSPNPVRMTNGSPYWRVQCWKNTPWFADWGWEPFPPRCAASQEAPKTSEPTTTPTKSCGSIINVGAMAVAEEIPLAGTGIKLRYDSNRVWGYSERRTIRKPLVGGTVPSNLTGASIVNVIEGRTETAPYTSFTTNMESPYTWDGLNSGGSPVGGSVCTSTQQYETISPPNNDYQVPGETVGGGCSSPSGEPGRYIGGNLATDIGLGGWSLSSVHRYDKNRKIIEFGDGRVVNIEAQLVGGTTYRAGLPDSNEIYLFNLSGFHIQTLNALTGSTKYTIAYHSGNRINTITDAYSKVLTVSYDVSLKPTKITGPFGHETLLTVDGNGYINSVTHPDTSQYTMTYSGTGGLLATFQKPLGQTSTFTYDGFGRLTQDAGVDGFVSNLARVASTTSDDEITLTSGAGEVTKHKTSFNSDPNYHVTMDYKSFGNRLNFTETSTSRTTSGFGRYNLVEAYSADPRFTAGKKFTSSYSYTPFGGSAVTTTTSKTVSYISGTGPFNINTLTTNKVFAGLTYQEVFTGSTGTLQYITPMSRTTTLLLNSQERPTSSQFADLTATTFTYNGNGLLSRLDQGARYKEFTYNAAGLISSVENALGQTTSFTYDSRDRLLTSTLPDSSVVAYTWDANDNLTSVTPQGRPAHGFSFTDSDTVQSYDPPALTGTVATAYEYDLDRRLKKITRPNSDQITLNYTTHNLSSMVTPQGTYGFGYDSGSNVLLTATSPYSVTMTRTYLGELLLTEIASSSGSGKLEYTYDSKLRPSAINIKNNANTLLHGMTYTYNNDSEITAAQDLTLTRHSTRAYVTGLAVGSVTETRGYNAFGELNSQNAVYSSTALYDSALTRDNLGRVTQNVETIGGTTTTYDYTYNTVGRLTAVSKNSSAYSSYSYDGNGNRSSRTVSGVTVNTTTNDQDRLLTHGTLTFTYNANGEVATKTDSSTGAVTTYTFDTMGSLKRVDLPASNYVEYLMDGFNRRVTRKYNGTVDRHYVYQNQLQIAAELNSSGALIARYVYASRSNVPDYMIKGGVNYQIISDQLGSVRVVARASDGVIMQRIDYDEFGRVLADSSPGFQPFGFAGGLYDGSTSLVHFGAREYDAEIGRWLSKDPILFSGGDPNLYGYVMNDPVNFVDPSGLKFWKGVIKSVQGLVNVGLLGATVALGANAATGLTATGNVAAARTTIGVAALVGGFFAYNALENFLDAYLEFRGRGESDFADFSSMRPATSDNAGLKCP